MWKVLRVLASTLVVVAAAGGVAWWIYTSSTPGQATGASDEEEHGEILASVDRVKISAQAEKNLGIKLAPLRSTTFSRTVEIPGLIKDRPGISDRGVVAPVTGIVTRIHVHPGDTIAPGAVLFTLRLQSESLHASQLELFKATREAEIAEEQHRRLKQASQSGAIAQARLIEIENQLRRTEVNVQAYRQDLQSRGLPPESIASAARGEFITEIQVHAPSEQVLRAAEVIPAAAIEDAEPEQLPFSFELQELNVELGEQVAAGEVLCELADHRALVIEGRGFPDDMPLVQQAARDNLDVLVEYDQQGYAGWPAPPDRLRIHHVGNSFDPESRTFEFDLFLENQWQSYQRDGETRLLWRFRPGDRVRLHVAVQQLENVFVVPTAAVVRQGPEAYVFHRREGAYERKSVHVLHEDRRNVVLANDGSLREGAYVAQNGAASLNRVLKAQTAGGETAGVHVHADGTVHESH